VSITADIPWAQDNLVPLYAGLALSHMVDGNEDAAVEWLKKIPRSERGEVNIALEDLQMRLGRLGRG
jgi:hypothetical protein